MKVFRRDGIAHRSEFWTVLSTTGKSQVAVMVLDEGKASGEYGTDHPQADQALYCVSGSGEVNCDGKTESFEAGDLLLIPAGAKHQVKGRPGGGRCVTMNFYGPPAYPDE